MSTKLQMPAIRYAPVFSPEECREIVARAVAMGTMSYPGGAKTPPAPPPPSKPGYEERQAIKLGISLEAWKKRRSRRDKMRRKKETST